MPSGSHCALPAVREARGLPVSPQIYSSEMIIFAWVPFFINIILESAIFKFGNFALYQFPLN